MVPPTDQEMKEYPYVFFTSDMSWNPILLGSKFSAKEILLDKYDPMTPYYHPSKLNNYG